VVHRLSGTHRGLWSLLTYAAMGLRRLGMYQAHRFEGRRSWDLLVKGVPEEFHTDLDISSSNSIGTDVDPEFKRTITWSDRSIGRCRLGIRR